ncbi:hypothetical protein OAS39_07920, partial [Pirellulales bacterium]|nr:hypothetical protein [Pirellulales bacterium]
FYLPYHFYSTRWGIYLKASGIIRVASLLKDGMLKGGLPSIGDDDLLHLAQRILCEHEFFHFVAETACARAEVVAKKRLYDLYYPHPFAAPHEEALANAHSFLKALVGQPGPVKKIVGAWMAGQGPGYRDYKLWLPRGRFDHGCRRAAHHMLETIGRTSLPSAMTGPLPSASERQTGKAEPLLRRSCVSTVGADAVARTLPPNGARAGSATSILG